MGKQSTLGKFWGKPGATQASVKTDGKTEGEDKDDKVATSNSDQAGPRGEIKVSAPSRKESGANTAENSKQVSHEPDVYHLILREQARP